MTVASESCVAIVPARGGSKRIPGKNIRPFRGKPMLAWPVEAARESGLFERILVSTDSDEIAGVARAWGAEVPSLRPASLSDDTAPLADVFLHALTAFLEKGRHRHACCILPTAILLRPADLRAGLERIRARGVSAVVAVTSFPAPILRAMREGPGGRIELVFPEHEYTRSNDLPATFHDAGKFYWLDVERFLAARRIYAEDALPLFLPRHLVQDIDTLEDWEMAERLFDAFQREAGRPAGDVR